MNFTEHDKEVLDEIWSYLLDKSDDFELSDSMHDLISELFDRVDTVRDEIREEEE